MSPVRTSQDLPVYEYPKETAEKREHMEISMSTETANKSIVVCADLEALDISKLDQPVGKQILVEQVLSFINRNGPLQRNHSTK